MIFGRVRVPDHLGLLNVFVVIFTRVFFDGPHWEDKLADVDTCRLRVLLQEASQLGQVVVQIVRLLNLSPETIYLVLLCLNGFFLEFVLLCLFNLRGKLFLTGQVNVFFAFSLLLRVSVSNGLLHGGRPFRWHCGSEGTLQSMSWGRWASL